MTEHREEETNIKNGPAKIIITCFLRIENEVIRQDAL